MSDSKWYPVNLCPDNDEVDILNKDWVPGDLRLQSTLYSVHLLLVYTRMVSSHLISCYINKNIYEILDQANI